MLIYKPSDKGLETVAQIKVSETPTYTYPILTANQIFIKDQDTVILYTL
ncbi:MAG TPA: hypothetical protein PKB02_15120 [Anaerohalosphaeraceae bacterium]|nr:hypothetical protein [Anaerohalosphaeraceae bacterium]